MGVFKSIGRALGRFVENVGDCIGSDFVSNLGQNIQDFCAEKIGAEKSYCKENATVQSIEKLNEILCSFSKGYYEKATNLENDCIRKTESFYDDLISIIESEEKLSYNKANLNLLKRERTKVKQTISGAIKNPLAKRMSLDDTECLKILKMDAGSEKTKAMSSFSKKIINEALDNLAKQVRISMNEQIADVVIYLKNIAEEQEIEFSKLKLKFDDMCKNDTIETADKEKHCIEPLLIISAINEINAIIVE